MPKEFNLENYKYVEDAAESAVSNRAQAPAGDSPQCTASGCGGRGNAAAIAAAAMIAARAPRHRPLAFRGGPDYPFRRRLCGASPRGAAWPRRCREAPERRVARAIEAIGDASTATHRPRHDTRDTEARNGRRNNGFTGCGR